MQHSEIVRLDPEFLQAARMPIYCQVILITERLVMTIRIVVQTSNFESTNDIRQLHCTVFKRVRSDCDVLHQNGISLSK